MTDVMFHLTVHVINPPAPQRRRATAPIPPPFLHVLPPMSTADLQQHRQELDVLRRFLMSNEIIRRHVTDKNISNKMKRFLYGHAHHATVSAMARSAAASTIAVKQEIFCAPPDWTPDTVALYRQFTYLLTKHLLPCIHALCWWQFNKLRGDPVKFEALQRLLRRYIAEGRTWIEIVGKCRDKLHLATATRRIQRMEWDRECQILVAIRIASHAVAEENLPAALLMLADAAGQRA